MADQERSKKVVDLRKRDELGDHNYYGTTDHLEETSAEIAAPSLGRGIAYDDEIETGTQGKGIGFAAVILSILSLFVSPILFGAAGIVLGFIAKRRGADNLGSWAVGIGAVSIIVGIFILPFF